MENFTNFLSDRMMECSTKGYCYFYKAVSNNYFQKVLLINLTNTYANLLKHFSFVHFLLIERYEKQFLRKGSVIATFVERFKVVTLRKPACEFS